MSILAQPIWPDLRPYVRIEIYARDGGAANARHRIEIDAPADGILLRKFLATVMPCVKCQRRIHPIRLRAGGQHVYCAATCELSVSYACARSRAARDEYDAVRAAVEQAAAPPGPTLFDGLL